MPSVSAATPKTPYDPASPSSNPLTRAPNPPTNTPPSAPTTTSLKTNQPRLLARLNRRRCRTRTLHSRTSAATSTLPPSLPQPSSSIFATIPPGTSRVTAPSSQRAYIETTASSPFLFPPVRHTSRSPTPRSPTSVSAISSPHSRPSRSHSSSSHRRRLTAPASLIYHQHQMDFLRTKPAALRRRTHRRCSRTPPALARHPAPLHPSRHAPQHLRRRQAPPPHPLHGGRTHDLRHWRHPRKAQPTSAQPLR